MRLEIRSESHDFFGSDFCTTFLAIAFVGVGVGGIGVKVAEGLAFLSTVAAAVFVMVAFLATSPAINSLSASGVFVL